MSPREGEKALSTLRERDGIVTLAVLADGKTCQVLNVAWGRDMGDEFDHITTNISPTNVSPSGETLAIDFFFTSEITTLIDPITERVLFEASSSN